MVKLNRIKCGKTKLKTGKISLLNGKILHFFFPPRSQKAGNLDYTQQVEKKGFFAEIADHPPQEIKVHYIYLNAVV